ncbi:VMS1 homolog C1827,04 [Schizosaccharomyces pombe 972h-] [Rhizoctonia solani]|uniref:VMS1 homolog C1827,04 [Schizosaccharomyces pombe 972h-] n=1 Tax=Rhizoctonia solani TaxID=456999 RepID=A0A0K6GHR6_9AGAM|nr:VMS1 homolog C1827,04 [Schizosaccharomyces pombe 972h-] [Rhizoctonia solani]
MATPTAPARDLKEPIHVFSIPADLLEVLSLRESSLVANPPPVIAPKRPTTPPSTSPGSTPSCTVCLGANMSDVKEQRAHFRSDWHRYNVKMRLQDVSSQPVSEEQFTKLIEDLAESLSGSESSTNSNSSDDAVAALLYKKQKRGLDHTQMDDEDMPNLPRSPIAWFQAPNDYPDTQFGVYTALFPTGTEPTNYVRALQDLQTESSEDRLWTMLATAGGHFAALVVRVKIPRQGNSTKGKKAAPQMEIIKHKTFHRYTTRRKQGGSQSVNDNAKGPAKSAGAQLRRYGEQALREDIQGLLAEWSEDVRNSERIFFRASVSNRKMFWDWDNSPIKKGDERLRTFPFPTRRPTQAELMRCLIELTRVKTSHLSEDALRALEESQRASLPKPKAPITKTPVPDKPAKEKPVALSKEEELVRDRWRRVIDMVVKGRIDPLKVFWEKNSDTITANTTIPEWAQAQETRGLSTLLQVASAAGQEAVTRWLLEDQRADPTIPIPSGAAAASSLPTASDSESEAPRVAGQVRKAYNIAGNRSTRNVFRRAAYAHPEWYNWKEDASVLSVLSPEMEAERDKKKTSRRANLRDKLREREKAREEQARAEELAAKEAEVREREAAARAKLNTPVTGPQKLGGSGGSGGTNSMAGLTPEMRAKIERERRARAAEARLAGR